MSTARVVSAVVALGTALSLTACVAVDERKAALPTAPAPRAVCPDAGAPLTAGHAEAAMGLRALTVTFINCGSKAQPLSGYPVVRLLDEDGDPLEVEIDRGATSVTTGIDDPGPKPLTVQPGASAVFSLVWRNTYDDTREPPQVGTTALVTPADGGPALRLTPDGPFDLGSTGRLGVTAWKAAPAASTTGDGERPAPRPAGSGG
ncbi:DUF4232 domain-containing protein [Streptomyces sp. NPDC004726]